MSIPSGKLVGRKEATGRSSPSSAGGGAGEGTREGVVTHLGALVEWN
jgi:hypothetical protein